MEIDESDDICVPEGDATATLQVLLHPLVVLNISDHLMRTRVSEEALLHEPVFGVIYGKQINRQVELLNSYALRLTSRGTIDIDLFNRQKASFARNFEQYEILGWYAIASSPSQQLLDMHNELRELVESPILLLISTETEDVEIKAYETHYAVKNDKALVRFLKTSHRIVSDEAERIGVDHVAQSSVQQISDRSQVETQLTSHYDAISMLSERLEYIHNFLIAVKEGKLSASRKLIREISSLCSQLPISNSGDLSNALIQEMVDCKLVAGLSNATKAAHTIIQMVKNGQYKKQSLSQEEQPQRSHSTKKVHRM